MRWFFITFLVAGFCTLCWAAEAQFPSTSKSRRAPTPQNTQTQVPAPEVPQVQAPPPIVNVAPPNVSISPQLVAPSASTMDEIKSWLNTVLGGLGVALLAKMGFRPAAPTVVVPGAVSGPANILLALRDKATDPAMRAKIDETLLTVLGTGVPSKLVQTGLGAVPVAGPVLAGVEPLLHDFMMNALKDRLAGVKP